MPVSYVPPELKNPPSLADLWPQMTGLITGLAAVFAFGDKILTFFLFVQKEVPVRVHLTNSEVLKAECGSKTVPGR